MKKLAVFVEGFTEVLFVEKFLIELAGKHNIIVEQRKIRGGTTVPKSVVTLTAMQQVTTQTYFVLIVDCGSDAQVKTRILEEHENLTLDGYTKIIGLRDVRPDFNLHEVPKLRQRLGYKIKTSLVPVEFILATMELEAWFLAEINHYQHIDNAITIERITKLLAFDIENDDVTTRLNPSEDLSTVYSSVGKQYLKGNSQTVEALDIASMYSVLTTKIAELKCLSDSIDNFMT